MSKKASKPDLITRGVKEPSPLGTATFFGLRALDPLWQYQILATGGVGASIIHALRGSVVPQVLAASTGYGFLDRLELSPHRLLLLGMSVGSMVKQNFWLLYISKESIGAGPSAVVGVLNFFYNSVNTLLFLNKATSTANLRETLDPLPVKVGASLFAVGILLETVSELQRKWFKDDPKNAGKVYTGGLWKFARHINYAGYMFWRAGYATAAGGWTFGAVIAAFLAWDFNGRAIPVLDEYCTERYAEQWKQYKRQTPYQYLPGIL